MHLYAERGPVKAATGSLLDIDLGPLLLTRFEREGDGVALTLPNTGAEKQAVAIGPGLLAPATARRTKLSGEAVADLAVKAGKVQAEVGPREWTRVVVSAR